MEEQQERQAREIILKRAENGKITCAQAFAVAEEAGVSRKEVGRLLNDMKIKVHACQLGCFP